MKSKITLLISLLIILSCLNLSAQPHPFDGGDGSKENPYLISGRSQLDSVRNRLGESYKNVHYRLASDIDLGETEWVPIGDSYENSFRGKLSGAGKEITNLNIGQSPNNYEYVGLFGYAGDGAVFDSVYLDNGSIESSDHVKAMGALIGYAECLSGTDSICISSCTNNNVSVKSVADRTYTGGLAGHCINHVKLMNCTNHSEITGGSSNTGGVVGRCYIHNPTAAGVIGLCHNYGKITTYGGVSTGGIAGEIIGLIKTISGCTNSGTLVSIGGALGGIAGNLETVQYNIADKLVVTDCINYGDLIPVNDNWNGNIGGIFGKISCGEFEMRNCENYGDLSIEGNMTAGGIIGVINPREALIAECVNYAGIRFESKGNWAGGITGSAGHTSFKNCRNQGDLTGNERTVPSMTLYTGGINGGGNTVTFHDCVNTGNLSGGSYSGGICGISFSAVFTNCINSGDIHGAVTGGIAGRIGNAQIDNCANRGGISGSSVGGIVGKGENPTIRNCVNYHDLEADGDELGGIAGYISGDKLFTIQNNINWGNLKGKGKEPGEISVGGIVGRSSCQSFQGTIRYCFNQGNITSDGNSASAGGILGYGEDMLIIYGCYSHSVISSKGDHVYAGGIAGRLKPNQTLRIEDVYAAGNVHTEGNGASAGGIAGSAITTRGTVTIGYSQALQHSINGDDENAHRIFGKTESPDKTVLEGNTAFEEMTVNGTVVTSGIGLYTAEGGDIPKEDIYKRETYRFAGISPWTIRNDEKSFPYFNFQSAPVSVSSISPVQVVLNAYAPSDSIVIKTFPGNVLVAVLKNIQEGDNTFDLTSFEIHENDTLALYNFETAKHASYAVIAETEEVPATGVALNKQSTVISVGGTDLLKANILPLKASNKNVLWSSDDEDIVMVNNNGVITGIKTGNAIITVTTEDGNYTDLCHVIVQSEPILVSGIKIDKNELSIFVNEHESLTAEILPSNASNKNMLWNSSDENIATITQGGVVTGISKGKATITVSTEDGNFTDICVVDVMEETIAVATVKLNKNRFDIAINGTELLVAEILPSNASNKNIRWESSSEDVVSVNQNGLITGLMKGTAVITVITEDGNYRDGCNVHVINENSITKTVKDEIKLYPSPVKDILNIESIVPIQEIKIYDTNGKMIKQYRETKNTISLSNFSKGIYIIELSCNNEKLFYKIVKEE